MRLIIGGAARNPRITTERNCGLTPEASEAFVTQGLRRIDSGWTVDNPSVTRLPQHPETRQERNQRNFHLGEAAAPIPRSFLTKCYIADFGQRRLTLSHSLFKYYDQRIWADANRAILSGQHKSNIINYRDETKCPTGASVRRFVPKCSSGPPIPLCVVNHLQMIFWQGTC